MASRTFHVFFSSLLCALFASAFVVAEKPPEASSTEADSAFSERVQVNLVNIDVFVRDGKGRPVTDLKREDFVVKQDGKIQEITNFAILDEEIFRSVAEKTNHPGFAVPISPDPEIPKDLEIRPIWVVVYVDNENLQPIDRTRVLRRLREFVRDNLVAPIHMMVVTNQAGLKIIQPFTDDAMAVTSAIRGLGTYSGSWEERSNNRMELIADMREAESEDYGRETANSGVRGQRQMYQRVVAFAREESNHLTFSLSALRQVVDTMAGLEGRKSIIYVSNGLPMTPGLGLMHEYASLFHDNSILSSRSRFDRQHQYQGLASAAASHEVTIYTLDAEGLEVTIGGGAESAYGADATASQVGSSNYQGSMRFLAERTGGIAVVNTNDVTAGLGLIRDDFFSFYSIGFPAGPGQSDRVHRIEVDVPDRGGLKLRFRRRFVEKGLESRVRDQVLAGLVLDLETEAEGLKVARGIPRQTTSQHWNVPIKVSFPLANLTLIPQGDELAARAVLIVGARDADGGQSDIQRQEHEILVSSLEEERPERWDIEVGFLMTEGRHRVVVGLMDQITNEVTYQTLNFSIP